MHQSYLDRSSPRRSIQLRFALAVTASLGVSFLLWPAPVMSQSSSWWEENRELSLEERRDRRRQFSDAFTAKLGPDYQTNIPIVSQQAIDGLGQAIARYRNIVASGGWRTFASNVTLQPNDSGRLVTELRRHLTMTGDMRARARRPRYFGAALQEAMARYQLRHGLGVTGFVDSSTRRALNVPAVERLRQLETNLLRLQDLMKINKSARYVLVNVPAYTMQAVAGGTLGLQSKVIVGAPGRQTPSVTARISELNFYPYWRVPDSIAQRDLIPQIRRDPSYFYRENFSVLPTWGAKPIAPEQIDWMSPDIFNRKFRQDPGANNALGVVRINMPNKHIVYMHDTPLKKLFYRNARSFSSGCVRVQRVLDLASWLLEGKKGWTQMRVNVTVALAKSKTVKLKKAVPVHFVYVTAWATNETIVHFRPDIYNRDNTSVQVAAAGQQAVPGAGAISP